MRVCDIFQVVYGKVRPWEMLALVVIMLMTSRNSIENQAASIYMIRKWLVSIFACSLFPAEEMGYVKWLALGDRKCWAAGCPQRLVEHNLSSVLKGFHVQSCHRPQTPQQIQATEISLAPKTENSLKLPSNVTNRAHHMSTSCSYRQSFVNLQSVSYSNFTVMLQDTDEIT